MKRFLYDRGYQYGLAIRCEYERTAKVLLSDVCELVNSFEPFGSERPPCIDGKDILDYPYTAIWEKLEGFSKSKIEDFLRRFSVKYPDEYLILSMSTSDFKNIDHEIHAQVLDGSIYFQKRGCAFDDQYYIEEFMLYRDQFVSKGSSGYSQEAEIMKDKLAKRIGTKVTTLPGGVQGILAIGEGFSKAQKIAKEKQLTLQKKRNKNTSAVLLLTPFITKAIEELIDSGTKWDVIDENALVSYDPNAVPQSTVESVDDGKPAGKEESSTKKGETTQAERKSMEIPNGVFTLSTAEAKPIWNYKKLEDGTTQITNYKGEATEIEIPYAIGKSVVTVIGGYAFSPDSERATNTKARRKISKVILPESILRIGDSAFRNCKSLAEIKLPSGLIEIGANAFRGCRALTNITIPDNVAQIGENVFCNCRSLEAINLSPDNSGFVLDGDILYDREKTTIFGVCGTIRRASICSGITAIDYMIFYGCDNLERITIPEGVRSVSGLLLRYCPNLVEIAIPSSVTDIFMFHNSGKVTIRAPKGSYAIDYAKNNNIPYFEV